MQLAQFNIAQGKADLEHPSMKEFKDAIEGVNELAESSPGFIWRLKDEEGNDATTIDAFDDPTLLVNMSVWEGPDKLKDFVYKTMHLDFLVRKENWFHKMKESHQVMWWIEDGHQPSLEEAKERLEYLRANGESPYAFTFRRIHTPEQASQ